MSFLPDISKSIIRRSSLILTKKERQKIGLVILLQICLSVLDLIGVAVIGVLGALAITGVGSRKPGNRVNAVLDLLNIQGLDLQTQSAILGLIGLLY